MGEIKFRAWITDYALMTDVSFLNTVYKEIIVTIDENDYEFNSGEYELMQYTGLKDKNGTEIYEGDIVDIGIPLDRTRKNFIGEISYCTEFACFRVDHPNIILISEYDGIEVIGNIYEHPHLI